MCGIVGYIGPRVAQDFLVEGLRRLEYRGYDSAGTATIASDRTLNIVKSVGRIASLANEIAQAPCDSGVGIGHTRWATHGAATINNAHPHFGGGEELLAIAHNGVIENFAELRSMLKSKGYEFKSETDTEVIAHLLADIYKTKLKAKGAADGHEIAVESIKDAIGQLRGTFGLAIIFQQWPDAIFAARLGSPLVIGVGDGEHFLASDAQPLIGFADRIVYLTDHQVAVLKADSLQVSHRDSGVVSHDVKVLDVESNQVEMGDYDHYMLKEIFEQPESLRNTMRGRLDEDNATAVFGGLNLTPKDLLKVERIVFTACGTSWHSALVGEYLLEDIAQIPVEVEYASELRYRNPPMDQNSLIFAITQSGETADTLGALREMKRKGHLTMAICNVVGSSIAQEADGGIYLHAGPEIGVASTKAYSSQCMALVMLALYLGRLRHVSYNKGRKMIERIKAIPDQVEVALKQNDQIAEIAKKYQDCDNFLYLGRHYNFPTALEGALKLKEISYIHAEGYPGPVIAVAGEGDERIAEVADDVIYVPQTIEYLQPIVSAIPLQLLSYHIALLRGCDVDKPRNLAKSVTVE